MKSLILLLMIGSAMGQTKPTLTGNDTVVTESVIGQNTEKPTWGGFVLSDMDSVAGFTCDTVLSFGTSMKAIKDIFPEECGGLKEPKSYIKMCSGITGKCDDTRPDAACVMGLPDEAPDVPAVTCHIEEFRKVGVAARIDNPPPIDGWYPATNLRIVCHKPVTK